MEKPTVKENLAKKKKTTTIKCLGKRNGTILWKKNYIYLSILEKL
jgi:hypothetical protein